jgi:hypothetical protein
MISSVKSFLLMILVSPVMFGQAKSDEWHLSANSRENYYGVAMANGQIGIVTDDTPLKPRK